MSALPLETFVLTRLCCPPSYPAAFPLLRAECAGIDGPRVDGRSAKESLESLWKRFFRVAEVELNFLLKDYSDWIYV